MSGAAGTKGASMHPLLEEIYASGKVTDAGGAAHDAFPAALAREDGELLTRVTRETGASEVLEIGMACGVSTLCLLDGLPPGAGRVTSIDPYQDDWFDGIGRVNVNRAGFSARHVCMERFSHEVLPEFLRDGRRFDLVFIDGNHRFEHTLVDFYYAFRLVPAGGHLLFHDVYWLPSVRKVLAYILRSDIAVESVPAFMPPAPRRLPRVAEHLWAMVREPRQPLTALTLRQHSFYNVAVLRKTAEQDEIGFSATWDHYRGC